MNTNTNTIAGLRLIANGRARTVVKGHADYKSGLAIGKHDTGALVTGTDTTGAVWLAFTGGVSPESAKAWFDANAKGMTVTSLKGSGIVLATNGKARPLPKATAKADAKADAPTLDLASLIATANAPKA